MNSRLHSLLVVATGAFLGLLVTATVLAFALTYQVSAERTAREEVVMASTSPEVMDAWQSALKHATRVGYVDPDWTSENIGVVHVDSTNPEIWGHYIYYVEMLSSGPVIHEQIVLYVPNNGRMGNAVHNVLVHEFLHAIHNRMQVLNPGLSMIDPEEFICLAGCCNDSEHNPVTDARW